MATPKKLEYAYVKERKKFGRQCLFSDANFITNLPPDPSLRPQFVRKDPIEAGIQCIPQKCVAETSTENESFDSALIRHTEGGWPKDLNIHDEEQTARYRKRIEREGKYEKQMKKLLPPAVHTVEQNNAVNVMEEYFRGMGMEASTDPDITTIDSISCFVCPANDSRLSASYVSFSTPGNQMVVAYCETHFPVDRRLKQYSCVWDINYSQTPVLNLESPSQFMQLIYNRKDDFVVVGGRADGIVSVFDTRVSGKAQVNSEIEHSHRAKVTALQWIQSKTNTEFFSAEGYGKILWWDARSMAQPYESYCLEKDTDVTQKPQKKGDIVEWPEKYVVGVTALEYIQSMPTRFSVGTVDGKIIMGNKRGMTPEERFPSSIKTFAGPVRSLERNPFSDKNFIAIGDCTVKIWSDESQESCIWQTRYHNEYLTCGCWNRNRGPTFFVGHSSGTVDVWDLLIDQKMPITSMKKASSWVAHIESHRCGNLLASAHENAQVHLLQVSDNIASNGRSDRGALAEMFERETKRDGIFYAKVREFRLLMAQQDRPTVLSVTSEDEDEVVELNKEDLIKMAQQEFETVMKAK